MKYWLADGAEQTELENLLRNKTIGLLEKPSEIQKKYAIFNGFSAAVFRKHLSLTKRKMNLGWPDYRDVNVDEESNQSHISEIDGSGVRGGVGREAVASSSQQRPLEPLRKKPKLEMESDDVVVYKKPPTLTTTFIDPETKEQKVGVSVQLFNGVKGAEFDVIAENGQQYVNIEYNWPERMSSNLMFKKQGGDVNGEGWLVPPMHPMVIAFEKSLMEHRANIEDLPMGLIKVKLPIEVKEDPQTWMTFYNKLSDDNIIFFIVFAAKEDAYTVNKQQKIVSFE